ncbi:MAG: hypothetical protein KDK01_14935 [Rhodobacteraceae bacterium]|jgi:hypothetical protein|nr:hypothetical protein [Paracoccaceae bacterium]
MSKGILHIQLDLEEVEVSSFHGKDLMVLSFDNETRLAFFQDMACLEEFVRAEPDAGAAFHRPSAFLECAKVTQRRRSDA